MTQKVAYSAREERALHLLKSKPQASTTLCKLIYHPAAPPFYGQQTIVGLLSTLARKVELNDEPFRVCKTDRAGPKPIFFWKE
jgi:hypothetical protein